MLAAVVLVAFSAGVAYARVTGGDFAIPWWTVDGGGGTFSTGSGGYRLGGTIGQPDAGVMTGTAGFNIRGGFWSQPPRLPRPTYTPCAVFVDATSPVTATIEPGTTLVPGS